MEKEYWKTKAKREVNAERIRIDTNSHLTLRWG